MSFRPLARLLLPLGVVAFLTACNLLPQSTPSTPTPPAPVAPVQTPPNPTTQKPPMAPTPVQPPKPAGVPSLDKKFSAAKLTLQYPSSWKEEKDATLKTQITTVKGTAFVLKPDPKSMLLETKIVVGTEKTCPKQPMVSTSTIDGVQAKQSNWSEPGKEAISEGSVYTISAKDKCYIVATIIRSCEPGKACAKAHAQPYDKASLYRLFDAIVQSIRFTK